MILNNEEFMERIKLIVGDRTDDEALKFIEDSKETIEANGDKGKYEEEKRELNEKWQKKYEENDNAWREKYKSRFFGGEETKEEKPENEPDNSDHSKKYTYDSLFKIKGEN